MAAVHTALCVPQTSCADLGSGIGGWIMGAGAVALSGSMIPAQSGFYLAGFSILVGGLGLLRWGMSRPRKSDAETKITPSYLGGLNLSARPSRSLTVVGLIATAIFMVLSTASFRKNVGSEWLDRKGGTGGFAFWIETTSPLNPPRDGESTNFDELASFADELGDPIPGGVWGDLRWCRARWIGPRPLKSTLVGGSCECSPARSLNHLSRPSVGYA